MSPWALLHRPSVAPGAIALLACCPWRNRIACLTHPTLRPCLAVHRRDVTILPEGTAGDVAYDLIKNKKQDAVVICDGSGSFVSV